MNQETLVGAVIALGLGLVIGGIAIQSPAADSQSAQTLYPKQVSFSHPDGNSVMWVLPGKRQLEQHIFGTPQQPKGFNHHTGVPLDDRLTNENGTRYTTTRGKTPFSDKVRQVSGDFSYTATDRSKRDRPDSGDTVQGQFSFEDPAGNQYTVNVRKVIPVGPAHPFLGGVAVDTVMHGSTGIGTMLQPRQYAYTAFWGVASISVNGKQRDDNRLIHVMTTERVRTADGRLMTTEELPREGMQTHVIMPPKEVTANGPQKEPTPTAFTLPNGKQQPFIHLVYMDSTSDDMKRIN